MMLRSLTTPARCRRVARVLQSYLDGETDPPTATAVAEHLEACRRCGLEASAYRAIKSVIATGRFTQVDPLVVARLDDFARSLARGGTA
jgi:anti-sigma factor RsiW